MRAKKYSERQPVGAVERIPFRRKYPTGVLLVKNAETVKTLNSCAQ